MGGHVFDNPKPVSLIKRLLQLGVHDPSDAIVLDFFAGSGTTAQAVMEANREDAGGRTFILVQLQEPTPADSPARKAGFESIADICVERVKRASAEVHPRSSKSTTALGKGDWGFRSFRLSPSNFRAWEPPTNRDDKEWIARMRLFEDPLAKGWTPVNVVWEVAVREGFPLESTVEKTGPGETWRVSSGASDSLIINLDDNLTLSRVEALGLSKESNFMCRDKALSDELAANLALQCRLKTI